MQSSKDNTWGEKSAEMDERSVEMEDMVDLVGVQRRFIKYQEANAKNLARVDAEMMAFASYTQI